MSLEDGAVKGVHSRPDAGEDAGETAKGSSFEQVGVNQLGLNFSNEADEPQERDQVFPGMNRPHQAWNGVNSDVGPAQKRRKVAFSISSLAVRKGLVDPEAW